MTKSSKSLSKLNPGDTIRVHNDKKWEPGVVVENVTTSRSYHVQAERGRYWRNRKHLMKTKEKPINIDSDDYDGRFEENIEADN